MRRRFFFDEEGNKIFETTDRISRAVRWRSPLFKRKCLCVSRCNMRKMKLFEYGVPCFCVDVLVLTGRNKPRNTRVNRLWGRAFNVNYGINGDKAL